MMSNFQALKGQAPPAAQDWWLDLFAVRCSDLRDLLEPFGLVPLRLAVEIAAAAEHGWTS